MRNAMGATSRSVFSLAPLALLLWLAGGTSSAWAQAAAVNNCVTCHERSADPSHAVAALDPQV